MNKTEFDNPIFQDLTAYNSLLKDIIAEFEKTKLSLSFVGRELETLDPFIYAKVEKNTKLNKKTKAYLASELKKIPKSSSPFNEMRLWSIIEDLNNLDGHCELLLSLCSSLYKKHHFEKLPVSFSICESMELLEDWRVCCKTEVLDYHADGRNYEDFWKYKYFLERISIFVSGCFSKTTERLSHISKIVNSYIESMVLPAAAGGKTGDNIKAIQEKQEGVLEPKPPEFLQKLLWIMKYGKRHWKLLLLAILIFLIFSIFVLPKFDLFSRLSNLKFWGHH